MTFSKLGTDTDTGQIVYLPKASRLQGLYIIGIQGTGKSGLIENLIMQDIDQQIGVCVLDPHGELIDHVIARLPNQAAVDRVIYLDINDFEHPFGLNVFTCADLTNPFEVQKTIDKVKHIFEKLLDVGTDTPLILEYLYNCTYTLIANPGYTMADIPLLLQDEQCRRKLVANVSDPDVRLFWQKHDRKKPNDQDNDIASTLRRVQRFLQPLTRNIVGQSKTTIDLQDIMNDGKILLVKLSTQVPSVAELIGSVIVALFLNAAPLRPANKRRQFHLYADEFQRFATEDFATLLEEARKFGIATTIAHQNRGQLNSANSKLETDLKDRSRSVGNMVIFKINSKDADDLAGEFDIKPQAAWEEEIEKEWVEVLKPEWYERVEEEVIDGEEEIKTPVKDVVHHLLNGGSHSNPIVNEFATTTLRMLDQYKDQYIDPMRGFDSKQLFLEFNTILYQVMITGNIYQVMPPDFLYKFLTTFHDPLIRGRGKAIWFTTYSDLKYSIEKEMYWGRGSIDVSEYRRKSHQLEQYVSQLFDYLWIATTDQAFTQATANLCQCLQDTLPYLWRAANKVTGGKYNYMRHYDYLTNDDWLPASQETIGFIKNLREVMLALAAKPIEVGSGLVRPRKRKQINYHTHPAQTLTHPRKVIMHPQRTYQDVQNELATQLVSLPNFSARVKTNENASQNPVPQNPGKKCLKCKFLNKYGANYCQGCGKELPAPNEYIIKTLQPGQGIGKTALQQRIVAIQARNLRDGFLKKRADVEAEILQRQTSCSGSSAPAQPQPHQQPSPQQAQARHARQVPVQGHCPTCNATNPRGSKFCNNCGTKLP